MGRETDTIERPFSDSESFSKQLEYANLGSSLLGRNMFLIPLSLENTANFMFVYLQNVNCKSIKCYIFDTMVPQRTGISLFFVSQFPQCFVCTAVVA